ncbi:MAG: response regulator transcription factor [Chloroflexi bacterium]|nr:response regulator transcription factor [Chloroflexota bacterium]MCH8222285.1 response regulator transcription factor [Chloroflexota bacterium]
MLRVLLVDDQELFRDMARSMFSGSDDFEVIAEAEDGIEAVNVYPKLNPDLVLMDMQMARMNGLEATREILKWDPDARVVMTSMRSEPEYQRLAIDMGAVGFIPKRDLSVGSLRDILGEAVRAAA